MVVLVVMVDEIRQIKKKLTIKEDTFVSILTDSHIYGPELDHLDDKTLIIYRRAMYKALKNMVLCGILSTKGGLKGIKAYKKGDRDERRKKVISAD
jgi:hypothetical protein